MWVLSPTTLTIHAQLVITAWLELLTHTSIHVMKERLITRQEHRLPLIVLNAHVSIRLDYLLFSFLKSVLETQFLMYSRLLLFRIPRDSLKYFEISVARHIRFAELRKNIIRLTTFNKIICNWTLEVRYILKVLWKRGEIAP